MKDHVFELVLLAVAIVIIVFGYIATQGAGPSSVTLTDAGVTWAVEKYRMTYTYPGMCLMICGAVLGGCVLLKRR